MKISVMIITKNEQKMLPECLDSVKFANEIVVVDDHSSDRTVEIAKKYNARVFKRKLDGFASQKNYGVEKCKNDWVFVLDADERVEEHLAEEIQSLRPKPQVSAYKMPRKNYIKNKWIKHGGLYPDYQVRLFRKSKCRYGQQEVHEALDISGKTEALNNDLIHYTYESYGEYLKKVKKYAELEAEWTKQPPKTSFVVKVFFINYFKEKGFLDGLTGLVSAVLLAYYQLIIIRKMSTQ